MPPARQVESKTASGLEQLAREQAALRRVATLVAESAPAEELFTAVAAELGTVVEADVAVVGRYESLDSLQFVGGWSRDGDPALVGQRVSLGGHNVSTLVFERLAPVRVDYREDDGDPATALAREWARSAAGAPIHVEGRLWGVMIVGSRRLEGLPLGIEDGLANFTNLVATAIANTQARDDMHQLAEEQASLRRLAILVAQGAAPEAIFAAVVNEVALILGWERISMARYEPDGTALIIGASSDDLFPPGTRFILDGPSILLHVRETGRPVRIDDYGSLGGRIAAVLREAGFRSAIGAPIIVDGATWGALAALSTEPEPIPERSEARLAQVTDLIALAISNATARAGLTALAAEQAALRRVATLVAEEASPQKVFAAVSAEGGRLFDAQCVLLRYDAEGTATVVAATDVPMTPADALRVQLGGLNAATLVFESGRPSRVDSFADDDSDATSVLSRAVEHSGVGAPIHVAGRLWGVVTLSSQRSEPFALGTEARLHGFAELVATAIANADARADLTASRVRVIATADETRQRIERDLHDGAQQRLVAVGLQLRAAQAAVPPELGELAAELERVATGLAVAQDELREYARGIHPAVLTKGGLAAALKALARRSTVPVQLDVSITERLPEQLELGVYYVVTEALTNAAKHASATRVDIRVEEIGGFVSVSVRDDGTGGAEFVPGSGLAGLQDRVEALGGRLWIETSAHAGTNIGAVIPLATSSSA